MKPYQYPVVRPQVRASLQADIGEDALARFVGVLVSLRRKYQDLLQPHAFDTERMFQWHGAAPGEHESLQPFIYL